ncbi:unnamed protein product, partial [Aphanomyces euteiches]
MASELRVWCVLVDAGNTELSATTKVKMAPGSDINDFRHVVQKKYEKTYLNGVEPTDLVVKKSKTNPVPLKSSEGLLKTKRTESNEDEESEATNQYGLNEDEALLVFLKRTQHKWLEQYLAREKAGCGYDNLLSVLQDFCTRNGYSYQQACPAKRTISDLVAELFHKKYGMYTPDRVFNVDETAIQFNMAPRYIWSPRGGNAKLASGEKHSYRMTAVLTIRADGLKLPILFVIRGAVGGIIDTKE